MYNEKINNLINAALADGELTEKEKQILFKNAEAAGIDLDEFEMVLDAKLVELKKAEAAAQTAPAASKSNKYGDVRKCPACGAIIQSLSAKCPECGYEFTNLEANSSSAKLFDLITKEKNVDKQIAIIENFPIPNTKADLLEFLMSLQPKTTEPQNLWDCVSNVFRKKTTEDKKIAKAYLNKYQECVNKAKAFFAGDAAFVPYVDYLPQASQYKLIAGGIVGLISILVIAMIYIFIHSMILKYNDDFCDTSIEAAIRKGNIKKAQRYYDGYKGDYGISATPLIRAYLDRDDLTHAKQFGIYADNAILFYDYYIEKHQYDKAEEYIVSNTSSYYNRELWTYSLKNYKLQHRDEVLYVLQPYYNHLVNVVKILCVEGKEEAKKYVDKKTQFFNVYPACKYDWKKEKYISVPGWTKQDVTKKLNQIIDSY